MVRKNAQLIPFPILLEFPEFFLISNLFCEFDIWSGYMVGGVGRYGIFSFLLSSLPSSLVAAASPPRFHPLRLHDASDHGKHAAPRTRRTRRAR